MMDTLKRLTRRPSPRLWALAVITALAFALASSRLAAAAPAIVLLSADNEGHTQPCEQCPRNPGYGGLAARATMVGQLRSESPGALLLLDAGNALFAGEGVAGEGKAVLEAYAAIGYDALNLSFRDFRHGRQRTLDLISASHVPFVSANLLNSDSGKPLAKPYIVKEVAGRRVAIIGLTQAPAGMEFLPHLRAQLQGIKIRPPEEALAEWLPKARSEAGQVLLLYYGSPQSLAKLRNQFANELAGILLGGVRPEQIGDGGHPPLAATDQFGKHLARITLPAPDAPDAKLQVAQLPITPSIARDPKIEELLQPYRPKSEHPLTQAKSAGEPPLLPPVMEPDKTYPLQLTAANRAVRLTVLNALSTSAYASLTASPGQRLLVLAGEWENIIALTAVRDSLLATTYKVNPLNDHLYLVINGQLVSRLAAKDNSVAGHVPVVDFTVEKIGDRLRGNLAFELPSDLEIKSLELRFYDYAHGHFALPLSEAAGEQVTQAQPLSPPQKNELLEVATFGLERSPRLAGQAAPEGMQFVAVDLRARSLFKTSADATAFDPKARAGQMTQVGTVADWTDAHKYLQLVVDGEYGYVPEPALTHLAPAPRFLPDVMTGGWVVFLAPAEAQSLELRCDFPNARMPDGKVIHPRGLTLTLEGKRPGLAHARPLLRIQDDFFHVEIIDQSAADSFAGRAADAGKRFVVLNVTVNNRAESGEFFQTAEQLKIADAAGQQLPIDAATYDGTRRPAPQVWIPSRERRSFQVAYQLDVSETRPRLAYAGVSKTETLDLARLAPKAAKITEATPKPESSTPADAQPPADSPPQAPAPAAVAGVAPTLPTMIEVDGRRFPARVPLHPDFQPRGIDGVGLTAEQVNAAIDRGADFLWKKIQDDIGRRWNLGQRREHTIMSLALVHADAHHKYPEFDAALRKWLGTIDPNNIRGTYEIGILCMLIEAYGDPTFLPQLRDCTKWLVETQGTGGSWGYGAQVDKKLFEKSQEKQVLRIDGGRPIDAPPEQITRQTAWKEEHDGDTSATQYAILGLNAAERSGIRAPAETWKRALAVHLDRQSEQDGGWSYHGTGGSYGSMTCAGICAIALTLHSLGESPSHDAVERGLGWMNAHFTVSSHPRGSSWLYYYLYSLERVGRILDTEFIGDNEWYPLGARFIVDQQQPDGSWVERQGDDPDVPTSFALLFLMRATPSLVEPQRSGPGTLRTIVALPPGRMLYIILDASGSMLEQINGRTKFEIARDALSALISELPANARVALRVYGHRRRAIEEGASEDSQLVVPMAPIKKEQLLQTLGGLRARGKTPLAYSLEQARGELSGASEESPLTVLLLTDGGEDTQPRRDPIAAAAAFAKLPNVRLRIVGFDINRDDWSRQLHAMAQAANGQYLPAAEGEQLVRELRAAVFETPEQFAIIDTEQKQVAAGKFGDSIHLPAGQYRIRAAYAGRVFEQSLWINPGAVTTATFEAVNVSAAPAVPSAADVTSSEPPVGETAAPADPPGEKPQAKFCTQCGNTLKPDAKFCTQCGNRVTP